MYEEIKPRYRAAAAAWNKRQDGQEQAAAAQQPNPVMGSKASQISARRLARHGTRMGAGAGRLANAGPSAPTNALPRGHPAALTENQRAAAKGPSTKAALPKGHPAAKHHQMQEAADARAAKGGGPPPLNYAKPFHK